MKVAIIVLMCAVFILGCTRYVEVEKNITIEKIVYKNITTVVKEKCNVTFNDQWDISKSRELDLIRRIRFLENELDGCIFDEDYQDDLEDTEEDLDDCEDDLDDTEEELDDVSDDLGDCKKELCDEYNASGWC